MTGIAVGSAQGVGVRGVTRFVWWGCDVDGVDAVAVDGGAVRTFASIRDCTAWARAEGFRVDAAAATGVTDLDAALPWAAGAARPLVPGPALDVVNLSIDVAHSLGLGWDPRFGRYSDAYQALFAAAVPWFSGRSRVDLYFGPQELADARALLRTSRSLVVRALGA